MEQNIRRMVDGWIEKARHQLDAAKDHQSRYHPSECIEASQECIELAVKATLLLLDINF